jgi:hypothetical protein
MPAAAAVDTVEGWSRLFETAPLPTLLALALAACVYLYRSKERLQERYTADLVDATKALNELSTAQLERAFQAQQEAVAAAISVKQAVEAGVKELKDEINRRAS